MGGPSSTNTVTKQDNTPWGPAQPSLTNIYSGADAAYAATPKTAYQGSYIAPQSQATLLAQSLGMQLAGQSQGQGNGVINNSNSLYDTMSRQLSQGAGWNPAAYTPQKATYAPSSYSSINLDPMGKTAADYGSGQGYMDSIMAGAGPAPVNGSPELLRGAINASLDPVLQNLQEKIIPQAKLNAVGSGAYGGDASDQAMSTAITDNYTRTAANIASQLGYQDYTRQAEDAQKLYGQKVQIGADAANNSYQRMIQDYMTSMGLKAQQSAQANAQGEQQAQFATGTQTGNISRDMEANNSFQSAMLQKLGLMPGMSKAGTDLVGDTAANLNAGFQLNALPIDAMTQIGQGQDAYNQTSVKALYQQWLDQLNAPWQGMDQYSSAIKGYPVNSSGTSQANTTGGGLF